jgi:hypothetical protein
VCGLQLGVEVRLASLALWYIILPLVMSGLIKYVLDVRSIVFVSANIMYECIRSHIDLIM